MADPTRHHRDIHSAAFGTDTFGRWAERFARFFGTPKFIIGQTVIVVLWIGVNAIGLSLGWDPYPFILLNLAFSTQAAYAAPLILLAQARQADRDKATTDADAKHREELSATELRILQGQNKVLAQQDETLALIHKAVSQDEAKAQPARARSRTTRKATPK